MVRAIISWSLHNRFIVLLGVLALIGSARTPRYNLNVEAYPDPTPPLVEVITQNPGASPEEMERLIGIPLETALNGMPGPGGPPEHLDRRPERHQVPVRLRDRLLGGPPGGHQPARLDRQPPAGRHARASRPGARPARSSATCSKGPGYTTNQLKAVQDWVLNARPEDRSRASST